MPINEKIALGEAIKAINADAKYTYLEDDIDTIEWLNDTAPVSKEDILAKQAELQVEYDAQEYARKRKEEYPSIEEAVHAILDDDLENLQILRQAVKEKYPK
jgi:hypothetical protein